MLEAIVPAFGFGVVAGLMPGPLQTFLLLKTLERGARGGLWVVPSPLLSDGPIIALCLLVLSRVGEGWLRALSVAGGLFLLYLARDSWRALSRDDAEVDERVASAASRYSGPALLVRAALLNALGPGPWLFWGTVMGPMLIRHWRVSAGHGVAVLATFYGTLLALLVAQLLLFSYARRLGPRIARAGTWLGIALLVVFAALLLLFGTGAIDRYGI
jgi:threonine/homoserine/homoserine lactone efflux protein